MTSIPFEQVPKQIAQILEQVVGGEELVITRNGRPVARLVPEPTNGGAPRNGATRTDLNRFAGILSLREDPLQYQQRIRDEWP